MSHRVKHCADVVDTLSFHVQRVLVFVLYSGGKFDETKMFSDFSENNGRRKN